MYICVCVCVNEKRELIHYIPCSQAREVFSVPKNSDNLEVFPKLYMDSHPLCLQL